MCLFSYKVKKKKKIDGQNIRDFLNIPNLLSLQSLFKWEDQMDKGWNM